MMRKLAPMERAAIWSITPRLAEARAEEEAFALGGIIRLWGHRLGEQYSNVLNVPCGLGRHDDALRKQEFNVIGVDLDSDFIRMAQNAHPQWSYHYRVGDMRKLPFGNEVCPLFDVVLNLFTSIGYNGKAGDMETFSEFHRVLRKDGLLAIETHNREPFKERLRAPSMEEPDNGIVRIVQHEVRGSVWTLHNTLFRRAAGGDLTRIGKKDIDVTLYSPGELTSMLKRSGFEVLAVYGGYNMKQVSVADTNMLVVARRK